MSFHRMYQSPKIVEINITMKIAVSFHSVLIWLWQWYGSNPDSISLWKPLSDTVCSVTIWKHGHHLTHGLTDWHVLLSLSDCGSQEDRSWRSEDSFICAWLRSKLSLWWYQPSEFNGTIWIIPVIDWLSVAILSAPGHGAFCQWAMLKALVVWLARHPLLAAPEIIECHMLVWMTSFNYQDDHTFSTAEHDKEWFGPLHHDSPSSDTRAWRVSGRTSFWIDDAITYQYFDKALVRMKMEIGLLLLAHSHVVINQTTIN